MEEVWKKVKGFEKKYQISNLGRLKNIRRNHIYRLTNKNKDYFVVNLYDNDKRLTIRIHRLVALAFIPNPNDYPMINHIDGNKQNNNIKNLEWCNAKQNNNHATDLGLMDRNLLKKINKSRAKQINQYDLNGVFLNCYDNSYEASIQTKVCQRNILQVCSKEPYNKKGYTRKQAGGFIWEFKN